jgi:hypothetical protein
MIKACGVRELAAIELYPWADRPVIPALKLDSI